MRRNLDALTAETFDLVIVGGGIHGASAVWEAARLGLRAALIERDDFGGGASANSLKVIHGGLRYLQQADFRRMRESIRERAFWLRTVPRLVRPAPFLVATRGKGKESRMAMRTALAITDSVGYDRNRGLPPNRRIPSGRILDRVETLRAAPLLDAPGITGGALWHDGLAIDTERIPLLLLKAASATGAIVANRVEAISLLREGNRATGVEARDTLGGLPLRIRGRVVLAATGGRIDGLLPRGGSSAPSMALAMNLVTRKLPGEIAFGVRSPLGPASDPVTGGHRFLFFVPWRERTLIGTFYRPVGETIAVAEVTDGLVEEMIAEVNAAVPRIGLSRNDVCWIHRGMLPLKGLFERGRPEALLQHGWVVDNLTTDAIDGLLTIVGVKYTTARGLSEEAIVRVLEKLGRTRPSRSPVDTEIDAEEPDLLSGTDHGTLEGRFRSAIRDEMAISLCDLLLRRTGAGSAGPPEARTIALALRVLTEERGLEAAAQTTEIDDLRAAYRPLEVGSDWGNAG